MYVTRKHEFDPYKACRHPKHLENPCQWCKVCQKWILEDNADEYCEVRVWVYEGNGSRKPYLSRELIEEIAKKIEETGAPVSKVCESMGFNTSVYNRWTSVGEQDIENDVPSIEAEFMQRIKAAQASIYMEHIGTLARASRDGDWKAGLEYLKAFDKDNFAPKKDAPVQLTHNVVYYLPDNGRDEIMMSDASPIKIIEQAEIPKLIS